MNQLESEFLKSAVPAAQASQRATGVPASITLAQAILESGWGQSKLARVAFNFFGVKATHLDNPETYVEMPTTEDSHGSVSHILAKFERYASPAESFAAHAALLANSQRYQPAMAVCHDPAKFALQLQQCGYSTLENSYGLKIYAARLMSLVQEFDLTQYDLQPDPPAAAQEKAA